MRSHFCTAACHTRDSSPVLVQAALTLTGQPIIAVGVLVQAPADIPVKGAAAKIGDVIAAEQAAAATCAIPGKRAEGALAEVVGVLLLAVRGAGGSSAIGQGHTKPHTVIIVEAAVTRLALLHHGRSRHHQKQQE
jgi:hypothetical protein